MEKIENGIVTSKKATNFSGKKIAILAAASATGEQGGAERLYLGIVDGFRELGCSVDLISVPADESTFEKILENYHYCEKLDLAAYDAVVSTKVPTYAVRHPRHILFLVHTVRVFDDMFSSAFKDPTRDHFVQRAKIHHLDYEAMSRTKAKFAIGHEVARRLYRWRGIDAQTLHPPLGFNEFREGRSEDYFFLPGRLHSWKRVDLIVKAIRKSKLPLRFLIAGTGSDEGYLRELAAGDTRIEFLGRISDEDLVRYYSGALAVPFTPLREDYGYITLEAFASGKPVITCSDSGEPTFFVQNFETGLIAQPSPESIQDALEWIYENRDRAFEMGKNGKRIVANMSWEKTAAVLAAAAFDEPKSRPVQPSKVTVLDMQPIDPPVGGGRLRLLGLYHNLHHGIKCHYVGSYDWPGEKYRNHLLSDSLVEIDVPLSDEHHSAAATLGAQANGKCVIDLAFSRQGMLSPEYVTAARKEIQDADVVIFSHPWIYPLVRDYIRHDQIVIYDSHNVEAYLRAQFLEDSHPVEHDILKQVVQDEYDVGRRADWILACSQEDLLRFNRIYDFPVGKIRVVPNGVMAFGEAASADRNLHRVRLGLESNAFVAIFIGSNYGPNIDAARFIADKLATEIPDVTFVIAGGVGGAVKTKRKNVVVTGFLDESSKISWLAAADIAVNPMLSGSGTNIKMFDFMAFGLPIVSTAIGARGIDVGDRVPMVIANPTPQSFEAAIKRLKDKGIRQEMGQDGRKSVEEGYAWERISHQLGAFVDARQRLAGQPLPLFSVVIPTYERPVQLSALIECLQAQLDRDFEVVIVDQSELPWDGAEHSYGFPMTYHHTPVKGAVRARNTGAMLAQGEIVAFVDDDCLPNEDWLLNARKYFANADVVGVEGRIESNHYNEPDWRPVTNVGFEGLGFMTANLFVRSAIFQYLGGFDLRFDNPHFREDTDLGWRMQELGSVPYAQDVIVFHPAQPRSVERESFDTRVRFFVKDALLYSKHPARYKELFLAECHYKTTPGFFENLFRGFEQRSMSIPTWIAEILRREQESDISGF